MIFPDPHCGSQIGLCPPEWSQQFVKENIAKHNKFADVRKQCWEFYEKTVSKLGHIDIAILMGDLIEGRGERSGGTELLTTDRIKQCAIAERCIDELRADKKIMVYGTDYHTGSYERWESIIADNIGAEKIGSHEWLDINGVVFDIKHHLGSSSIPHGRYTALAKEKLWNNLWSLRDEQPKADVFIRAHVHYHVYCGDNDFLAMTAPALQGMGSRYGSDRCSGTVDFGLVVFDIDSKGGYTWQSYIAKLEAQKAKALKL